MSFTFDQNWIARVRVPFGASSRVAVSSVTIPRKTSAPAASADGAKKRAVTLRNAPIGCLPSDRAASSRPTGTWASPARRFTSARGRNISR